MRTIPNLGELRKPTEEIIRFTFIPVIAGDHIFSDHDPMLLSLSARFGELGIPMFHEIACFKYKNSRKINIVFVQNNRRTVIGLFYQQLSAKEIKK